jgi:hypothetical protein
MTPLDKKLANAKRQRARERAQAPDPATIAAGIDLATVAGHNLRALLLRLLDGEPWNENTPLIATLEQAFSLGLATPYDVTPLGREVAEQLRPEPWRVGTSDAGLAVVDASGAMRCACEEMAVAIRIAALLTADDLAQAKAYRSEPG